MCSYLFILGDVEGEFAEKIYGGKIVDDVMVTKRVSRKLEFFPPIEKGIVDGWRPVEPESMIDLYDSLIIGKLEHVEHPSITGLCMSDRRIERKSIFGTLNRPKVDSVSNFAKMK